MRIMKGAIPFLVTLVIVAMVTAVLFYCKQAGLGPHHPIFFYLLPIALIALLYGSLPATMFAIVAALAGTYFLYDPVYSFYFTNRLEIGDIICFAVLALMAVKCTFELLRPAAKLPAARARYGRL
jgi:K+-sensing histidine kinase KdpD